MRITYNPVDLMRKGQYEFCVVQGYKDKFRTGFSITLENERKNRFVWSTKEGHFFYSYKSKYIFLDSMTTRVIYGFFRHQEDAWVPWDSSRYPRFDSVVEAMLQNAAKSMTVVDITAIIKNAKKSQQHTMVSVVIQDKYVDSQNRAQVLRQEIFSMDKEFYR